jgi:hypothetical protein
MEIGRVEVKGELMEERGRERELFGSDEAPAAWRTLVA